MAGQNVVTRIVSNDLCVGCGVCAGLCPQQNLIMEWNDRGEYSPVEQGRCLEGCTLCLRVCPFQDGNQSEDDRGDVALAMTPGV